MIGTLNDPRGPERTATMTRLRRRLDSCHVGLSTPATPPHWACPDCGAPCYCIDPMARLLAHTACGEREALSR